MLETAAVILVFAVAFAAVGLPIAVTVRSEGEGWVAVIADSLVFGLVFTTVGITLWTWLGPAGAILSAVAWLALLIFAIRGGFAWPRPDFSSVRAWPWTVAWVVILSVAVLLRLHSVNFLPWVGDMGAYVNWANEFASSGVLASSWPPLFPVYLAMSSFAFGIANTASAVGLSGLILLITVVRFLQRLHVDRWVAMGAAILLALQPTAVWFSTFPVSESLDAPIFTAWAMLGYAALTATGRRLWLLLGIQALFMLALGLLRGSGALLMVPLVLVLVAVLIARAWRPMAPRMLLLVAANLLGAGIGFWYGVSVIRPYLVEMQIKGLVPSAIANALDHAGLLSPTPVLAVTLLAPVALLAWWGAHGLRRHGRTEIDRVDPAGVASLASTRWRGVVPVLLLGVAVVLTAGVALGAIVGAMVWYIILRLGVWLLVGAVLALVLAAVLRRPAVDQVIVALLGLDIVLFVGLHTLRLGFNRGHDFYRYWDRYLFSEVLPASLVLSAVALAVLLPMLARRWKVVIAVLAAGAAVVPAVGPLVLQSRSTYLAGAYDFLVELDELGGDTTVPRLWADTSETRLEDFFFVNTWMAFAVPLRRTFGLDIVNASQRDDNFGPDEVLSDTSLFDYAACQPGHELVVYEVQNVGSPLDRRISDPRIVLDYLGTATSSITTLVQPPTDGDWTTSRVTVEVWRATVPEDAPTPPVCSNSE
jgi:hypothetical protein